MDSLAWLYSRAARSHARLIARLFVLDRSATATAASKPATGGGETWHASTLRAEESDQRLAHAVLPPQRAVTGSVDVGPPL